MSVFFTTDRQGKKIYGRRSMAMAVSFVHFGDTCFAYGKFGTRMSVAREPGHTYQGRPVFFVVDYDGTTHEYCVSKKPHKPLEGSQNVEGLWVKKIRHGGEFVGE